MRKKRGKLIVIEGLDGSGKATQAKILIKRLRAKGRRVATFSFPQYGKPSAKPVEEYLNPSESGALYNAGPYMASGLFALDRLAAAGKIQALLNNCVTVVLDRYVDSNAGHQGGKIQDASERKKFLRWLYDFEYEILGLPRPDLVIILHVASKTGQRLVRKKKKRSYLKSGTHDAHESDSQHLRNAEYAYLWLAKQHPKDHVVIECMENSKLLPPLVIGEMVYQVVRNRL